MKIHNILTAACVLASFFVLSCATSAASAEEYYSIGMAYYEMGKFEDAERWLSKAGSIKKTMNASEYNLGRIAYETGNYAEAARRFEKILKIDRSNVKALRAAAYTQIMLENLDKADKYYLRVLQIEPESADDGYNHALVLFAMKKYKSAEEVLDRFKYNMPDNKDTLLLLARVQKAQDRPEAIDSYSSWLIKNEDPLVRYEYTLLLDSAGYYARAVESARKILEGKPEDTVSLKKQDVQFELARLILIADSGNEEGIKTLQDAVDGGFNNREAFDKLLNDEHITRAGKSAVQAVIDKVEK